MLYCLIFPRYDGPKLPSALISMLLLAQTIQKCSQVDYLPSIGLEPRWIDTEICDTC